MILVKIHDYINDLHCDGVSGTEKIFRLYNGKIIFFITHKRKLLNISLSIHKKIKKIKISQRKRERERISSK